MHQTTTSSRGTAVGYFALDNTNAGDRNSAFGFQALTALTTGGHNTAIGDAAMEAATTGNYNVAMGQAALVACVTGHNNCAVGTRALDAYTGNENTAVGTDALGACTTGDSNVAVGADAAEFLTTGGSCVAVGHDCLRYSNGGYNTAVGRRALLGVSGSTTGQYNTAIGKDALLRLTTGNQNTAIGQAAGDNVTTGNQNTYLGDNAGNTHATGINCVYVGHGCDSSATGVDEEIVIGVGLAGKGTNTTFIGGTNGPYNEANNGHWSTTSDQRIKKNIVDNTTGLDKINQVKVRNFEYKTEDEIKTDSPELADVVKSAVVNVTGVKLGCIAQEIESIFPDVVYTNEQGIKSVDPSNISWYMINAIKELSAENTALKNLIKNSSSFAALKSSL